MEETATPKTRVGLASPSHPTVSTAAPPAAKETTRHPGSINTNGAPHPTPSALHTNNYAPAMRHALSGATASGRSTPVTLTPGAADGVARSGGGATTANSMTSAWLLDFTVEFFTCKVCRQVLADPVHVLPDPFFACRRCARTRNFAPENVLEIPLTLRAAMTELRTKCTAINGGKLPSMDDVEAEEPPTDDPVAQPAAVANTQGRRLVRAKHSVISAAARPSPNTQASRNSPDPQPQQHAHQPSVASFQYRNPNVDINGKGTSPRQMPSPGAQPLSQQASSSSLGVENDAMLQTALLKALREVDEQEQRARNEAMTLEEQEYRELTKSSEAQMKAALGKRRGTSKMLKMEADEKYEKTEYTLALELYTKAIALQAVDRTTRLSVLYGNRSAANFMAQRHEDCINDCIKVTELEPHNIKMFTRAAKSAAAMGDLARAVSLIDKIPSDGLTDSILAERRKYESGLENLEKADSLFGTPEGDERWRMLTTQFNETVPFRVRYAESLCEQGHYMKAVEVLNVVARTSRTPSLANVMARCLYLSGFEFFDRAREVLEDVDPLDEKCAKLLKLITVVDNGKQRGNQLFSQKNFGGAVEHYTAAISAAMSNNQILRILYCNRAAANKELGKYREGVEDCTKAIEFDPKFSKAYARRARCHQHLNEFHAAVRDFALALQYDSTDHELARELRSAQNALNKEVEREKDYYYVLGITRNSSDRDIKLKYRELSLRWHPDKCMNLSDEERTYAERKFKVIGEAHATLIDPVKRREYDLKNDRERGARSGLGSAFTSTYGGSGDYFRGNANRYRSGHGTFW